MKSLQPATLLARASQPSCKSGAICRAYNIIQFNARMRKSVFFATAPVFRSSSRTGLAALEPQKAADRGKHAYPDGELQIAENPPEGGVSLGSQ